MIKIYNAIWQKSIFNFITLLLIALMGASCQPPEKKAELAEDLTQGVQHPEWSKEDVIYEVNIRQYTPEGTFNAFAEHLPRLKEMGIDILWLMPIHPIGEKNRKGSLGSYYSVKDYLAVNPEFGSIEDFRTLVEKVHEHDMYIILDWVANHTAWDNELIEEHPDWYKKDSTGEFVSPFDWTDVVSLDYENPEVREYMKNALVYWVEEENIDGYRCDVAGMVPTDFWENARAALDSIKPVFMLAEAEETDHHLRAFDMSYAWEMHHVMNKIAAGEMNANDIHETLTKNIERFPEGSYRMQFTSNHDENSWNGTVYERLGDAAKTFAALTYVIPGMPMIYNGQEAALDKRLAFFEKDSIPWGNIPLKDFYSRLNKLKENNEALWNGNFGGSYSRINSENNTDIYALLRQKGDDKVMAVFNLSGEEKKANLMGELHYGEYYDTFTNNKILIDEDTSLVLAPWDYFILHK